MLFTTVLLSGLLVLQDPPKPPAEPPRAGDSARDAVGSGAQVDAELRAAIDELRRASGYRFEVDGNAMGTERRPLGGGDDPKLAEPKRETFRLAGAFQKDKPAQMKSDEVEAFRSSSKLVWKGHEQKEWATLAAKVGEPPKADAGKGESDEARVAALLASLPLPDDLIRDFEERLVSCTRSPGADVKGAMATYECVVCADAKRSDAKSDAKNCLVRFTVNQGRIAEIDWRHPAEAKAATKPPAAAGTAPTIACHYKLSDVDSAQVTVPEDAAKLLGSR